MGPRVTQHGQVPPCIPLVHKPGGHLAADVTEQLLGRLIPRLLVFRLEQVLRKIRVYLQVRCILSVLFLQFFLKVSHAPLHPVELPLRGHALEDTGGLHRLGGVSLMSHHFREHGHGGFEVSGVGRSIVQSPASGRIGLGYLAFSHGLRPLRQCSGVALVPNRILSVCDGGLICVGLVREHAGGRQFLYVLHGGIRCRLSLEDGPHGLRDLPVVRCPAGDPDLPGRLLARFNRAVLLHHPLIYLVHQPTDFLPHLRFTPGPVLHLLHQAVDLAGELIGALEAPADVRVCRRVHVVRPLDLVWIQRNKGCAAKLLIMDNYTVITVVGKPFCKRLTTACLHCQFAKSAHAVSLVWVCDIQIDFFRPVPDLIDQIMRAKPKSDTGCFCHCITGGISVRVLTQSVPVEYRKGIGPCCVIHHLQVPILIPHRGILEELLLRFGERLPHAVGFQRKFFVAFFAGLGYTTVRLSIGLSAFSGLVYVGM